MLLIYDSVLSQVILAKIFKFCSSIAEGAKPLLDDVN